MNKKTEKKQSNGKHMIQGAGPGRPKGRKNTISKQVIEDIFHVYAGMDGKDGIKYLQDLRKNEPRLFARLVEKLMPSKIENEHTGNITIDSLINAWGSYEDK